MSKIADQRAFPDQEGSGMTLHQWFASQYRPTAKQVLLIDAKSGDAMALYAGFAFEYANELCARYERQEQEQK